MQIHNGQTDKAILREIGHRIKRERLYREMDYEDFHFACGVSINIIRQAENGDQISLINYIKILRGLRKLEELDRVLDLV